jgi:branched-chain amino acid transport system ATP-binding protein
LDKASSGQQIERALNLFPALKPKLHMPAAILSGGEAQMLALANAVIPKPRIFLLDEPSLGLAPPLASMVLGLVGKMCQETGVGALIVEQKVREILRISQIACVLRRGRVSYLGPPTDISEPGALRKVFL